MIREQPFPEGAKALDKRFEDMTMTELEIARNVFERLLATVEAELRRRKTH